MQGIARDSLHGFDEFSVIEGFAICISWLIDMNNEAFMASVDCVGEHGLRVGARNQRSFFAWLGAESICGFAQLGGLQEQQMTVALLCTSVALTN
ncbi:hypothetical protein [Bifidobacterium longum]|uniref:hypothetical protein n=1 Tax=Bifidobacterium longum TaxID=216816 RepID=UPI001F488642|nr:hypothetical protein [Bifidobacterium longum]